MKILVDRDRCEGNARCVRVAPDVFELDEHDQAHLRIEQVQESMRPTVEQAARLCPRQAISIFDA